MSLGKLAIDNSGIKDLYVKQLLSCNKIATHYGVSRECIRNRLRKMGIPRRSISEGTALAIKQGSRNEWGERSYNWKGGRQQTKRGYILIYRPDHHRARTSRYVAEHILVWEEVYSQPLPDGWIVHHLNGIKNDNRPSNLIALPHSKHQALIGELKKRIRELEIENKQLRRALEYNESKFSFSES